MAVFPLEQIYYVEVFDASEIDANSTVSHSIAFDHDCYINAITWSEDNGASQKRAELQVYYEDGDAIHTDPAVGMCAAGTNGFPVFFKRPLVIRERDNLIVSVGDISGEEITDPIHVVFHCTPTQKKVSKEQARSKIYVFNFYNIPYGQQQSQAVSFREDGHIYYLCGTSGRGEWVNNAQTKLTAKILDKGELIKSPTVLGQCCGNEYRPYWFKRPISIARDDVLQFTLFNDNAPAPPVVSDTTIERACVAVQFVGRS